MSDKAPKWYCTGTDPLKFELGTRIGRRVESIKAKVVRQLNGSWNWYADENTGNAYSRILAQEAAELALELITSNF